VREYKNDKGVGKIMKLELIDREGTMIEATMFNEVVDKWMNKTEENKVYIFANGTVKMANKKYTSIKNDFCLTFGNETEIQECNEDTNI
jgi:replication factor A1